jgi:hypothetical protein
MRLWHHDGRPIDVHFDGHKHPLAHVEFTQRGDGLVTLSEDQLRVWRTDGHCTLIVTPRSGSFTDFALLPDGRRAAVASTAATLQVVQLYAEDIEPLGAQHLVDYTFSAEELAPFQHLLRK